jgi:uncharacterized protein (UPF0548 family)
VFLWRKPDQATVERLLATQQPTFSYSAVGATQAAAPAGYTADHNRILIGYGLDQFKTAKAAVDNWKMFDVPWIEVFPKRAAVQVGSAVAVVIRHLGFWSVNISRIVYVIDEESRYGFAYGTSLCHSEEGEERFLVAHDTTTDEVWYDLYAFSKPKHPLARIGYPVARQLQKRFARESLAAMKRACQNPRAVEMDSRLNL